MTRFTIISLVAAVISGFAMQGSFLHWLLIGVGGLYVLAPMALLIGLWFLISWGRTGGVPRLLKNVFWIWLLAGCSALLSLGIGYAVLSRQIENAHNYVAKVVPLLDAYKAQHGVYPADLSLVDAPPRPKLLSKGKCFYSDGNSFTFDYDDPSGMMDLCYFYSDTRTWVKE